MSLVSSNRRKQKKRSCILNCHVLLFEYPFECSISLKFKSSTWQIYKNGLISQRNSSFHYMPKYYAAFYKNEN